MTDSTKMTFAPHSWVLPAKITQVQSFVVSSFTWFWFSVLGLVTWVSAHPVTQCVSHTLCLALFPILPGSFLS